ncbi:MAG: DUF971 domain-containing protein [Ignavibacterium sp.]|nr:DUF971 domain-containing protein [Melioribacteraceae bacterium]MCO6473222.1 DUF971 domain-containing protein [Melioribacteraceae bacterium]MDD5609660.1 DUF971 domain-containing protein [Ignavibacterium sp.]
MFPKKINIEEGKFLVIVWSDAEKSKIKLSNLRRQCPCAECLAEREKESKSYIPLYTFEQLKITDLKIIGKYALSVTWSDGHNLGIYEFSKLKILSEAV